MSEVIEFARTEPINGNYDELENAIFNWAWEPDCACCCCDIPDCMDDSGICNECWNQDLQDEKNEALRILQERAGFDPY